MRRSWAGSIVILAMAALAAAGCSKADRRSDTVASANGDEIKVLELREFLGLRGGAVPATGIPEGMKREALDRLVAGRLLAQDARSKGMDNTPEFRGALKESEQGSLIMALLRKELAAKMTVSEDDVKAETKKLRAADNTITEENARARAGQSVSEAGVRKLEEGLVAAAGKEFPGKTNQELIARLGQGEALPDNAVLGTVAGGDIRYGDVRTLLQKVAAGMGADGKRQDLAANPIAVSRMLEREMNGRKLAAYARKQGIEGSEWHRSVRQDVERMVLVDLLATKVIAGDISVTDREIREAYDQHKEMMVRAGQTIPLSAIREQLRSYLRNEKRKKVMEAYVAELRKKARITINEKTLAEA